MKIPFVREKKTNWLKIVLISAVVASVVAAGVTAFILISKKRKAAKAAEDAVDGLLDETLDGEDFEVAAEE